MLAIAEALLQSAIYCGAPTRTPPSTCSPTTDRLTDPGPLRKLDPTVAPMAWKMAFSRSPLPRGSVEGT
jgi:hypothetical protein